MTALYKLANQYAELMSEDFNPDDIADTLEGMEGEVSEKIEQLLALIKNTQALSAMLKAESKSLADRQKACDSKVDSIKKYLIQTMQTMDKKKFTAGVHSLTVRAPVASVKIVNETEIPPEFCEFVTSIKIDKNHIKEKLKLGIEVAGAELELGKPSLVIK